MLINIVATTNICEARIDDAQKKKWLCDLKNRQKSNKRMT